MGEADTNRDEALASANRRLALKLLMAVFAAFGFAFALVPLYDVLCQATGLNGKTASAPDKVVTGVDASRWVTVEFTGNVMPGLPWEFRPRQAKLRVHPGEIVLATYRVRNVTDRALAGQAIPSISPGIAARHFTKIECFCFRQQELKPGEARDMPLRFIVSRRLPPEVRTITVSYAFFNVERPLRVEAPPKKDAA
jgi:cytochrome c oxidase assembly protein subunit 11